MVKYQNDLCHQKAVCAHETLISNFTINVGRQAEKNTNKQDNMYLVNEKIWETRGFLSKND